MVSKNLPSISKLQYQSNIEIWWVCQSERIFVYLIVIWVNTILNHINTWTILIPGYEGSFMVYRSEEYQKQKYCQVPILYQYQIVIPTKYWYGKVRGSLNALNIWVNTTLNHTNTGVILPIHEGSCMVYRSKWY